MGILSSLFQTGTPVQQVAGPTMATSQLPKELAPYYKDILGKAQALYNERTAEGFQPYQGPTIADFTPEQQQAFTGLQGLVGSQAPVFQEGMDLTRTAAAPMTSEQMTQYMSPYQQAVTDIEKREATKQYESQVVPALAAKAATTGGFGGSRQAILEGMAADTQQRLLSDIQAKGSQQAYQDAVSRFQADRTAAGQAGAQLATMAPQQFKAQLGELGALQTVGEERQRQQQTALDEAFRQYQLERNYPYDTMGKYQAIVTGAPVTPTTFAPPQAPVPSTAQTLIGGIGTLANAYGQFTGRPASTMFMPRKGGGGLNDLPVVRRQQEGPVFVPEMGSGEDYSVINAGSGMFQGLTSPDFYPRLPGETDSAYRQRLRDLKAGEKTYYPERIDARDVAKNIKEEVLGSNDVSYFPVNKAGEIETEMGPGEKPLTEDEKRNRLRQIEAVSVTPNMAQIGASEKVNNAGTGLEQLFPKSELNVPAPPEQEQQIVNSAKENLELVKANPDTTASDLRAAEEAYINSIEMSKQKAAERAANIEKQRKESQFSNIAQFFARLGTATPRKEGIMGLIDAGLQVAPETLQKMEATNTKAREAAIALEDKQTDLERIKLKEDLGIKLSRNERKLAKEKIEREEEQFEKSLNFKYSELEASIQDSIRDAISSNTLTSSDFNSVKGFIVSQTGSDFELDADGNFVRVDGIALKPGMQQEINKIMGNAYRILADTKDLVEFNRVHAPQISQEINAVLTASNVNENKDNLNKNDPKTKRNINKAKIILEEEG
jgi:hypothetical protein